eukprot:COSAG02_NODE_3269_length_7046_cov_7.506118_2_plen_55_part_00
MDFYTDIAYMIGATGSVRGKKEFEPNSLAPESVSQINKMQRTKRLQRPNTLHVV